MPWTFKQDHLHPFKPLLFQKISIFFTFLLGGQWKGNKIITWMKCGFAAVAVVISFADSGINHANGVWFRHITLTLTVVLSLLSVSKKSSPAAALPPSPKGSRARIDRGLHRISGTLSHLFPMLPKRWGTKLKKIKSCSIFP